MSDSSGVDPYRFGRPEPVPHGQPTGREVISATWGLLRQDRSLIWLPVISTFAGLTAAAVLFVPGYLLGQAIDSNGDIGIYAGGLLAAFALSVVSIYFQAALVIGANRRADGGQPTLGGVLRQTWAIKWRVLGWAVLTTAVGAVSQAIEQRIGIFGKLLGLLGGIVWAIASFFVVPVLVAEGLGPIAAVKRSTQLIRTTWGTSVRTTLRLFAAANLLFIPIFMTFVVGIVFLFSGPAAVGVALLVLDSIAVVVLGSMFSAINTYARAMIYRFAVGRPVPGIDPYLLAGALVSEPKRRWWRR